MELFGHGQAASLCHLSCTVSRRFREEDGELIAAVTGKEIDIANLRLEEGGDGIEHLVPGIMPARIVDPLEMIDFNHETREEGPLPLSAGELLLQDLFE